MYDTIFCSWGLIFGGNTNACGKISIAVELSEDSPVLGSNNREGSRPQTEGLTDYKKPSSNTT